MSQHLIFQFAFRIKYHCCQTVVHVVRLLIGYILMLAVMTFNAWIGISVVIGELVTRTFHRCIVPFYGLIYTHSQWGWFWFTLWLCFWLKFLVFIVVNLENLWSISFCRFDCISILEQWKWEKRPLNMPQIYICKKS